MSNESLIKFSEKIQDITTEKVAEWWSIVDRMGMNSEKLESWNGIFEKQVSDLYDEMIGEATEKQNILLGNIEKLMQKCQDLCKDLAIKMPVYGSDCLSLYQEQELLEKRVKEYEGIVEDRRKEVHTLNRKESELSEALGRKHKHLPLSPLPSQDLISDFKAHLDSLESQKFERDEQFLQLKSAIVDIAEELKYKPILDFERTVLSPDDSLFLVTDTNMKQLHNFYEMLKHRFETTKEQISELGEKLKHLWDILSADLQECDVFLQSHTGISFETLEALKMEVKRCEALKKANIETFIKRLRTELVNLWDKCHYVEEDRGDFEYFHTSLFTEDLLTLHDMEIEKMKRYYATNSELFILLDKRNELWSRLLDLEERATEPNRYKNRGGQLLKEEKDRNTLATRIPKIEKQLLTLASEFELKNGRKFLSWGKTIEKLISEAHQNREEGKKIKLSARKQQRDATPGKSMLGLARCLSTQNLAQITPSITSSKRKIATPLFPCKRTKSGKENKENAPHTAPPKLKVNNRTVGQSRYSIERAKRIKKCRRISQRMLLKSMEKDGSLCTNEDYDEFKEDLGSKQDCRSTLFTDGHTLVTPVRPFTTSNTPCSSRTLNVPSSSTSVRPPTTPCRTPTRNKTPNSPRTISKLSTAPNLKMIF